ncbi:hypothetical protein Sste5346_004494 [Sporothrix stenoceras]|uniref:Uncharacterized protein n=1 Tax=Sporothrix stenoceras TaxID=5173 RepID=A0ABR3Z870_9PEZI
MGNCFSRDIDGYDRRTRMPPGGSGYYYGPNDMPPPPNGDYNMRIYDKRDMHPLGHRRRRRNRRGRNTAAIVASTAAAVSVC